VRQLKFLLLALLSTAFSGCAMNAAAGRFETLPLLSPAAFGAEASGLQRLTLARESGDATLILDSALEIDAQELRVAGFLLGQRILLLAWDGRQLQESREPIVPESLSGRAILRDLQLVYWPTEAIRAALPRGWRMEEEAGRRRLYYGAKVVLESERGDAVPLGDAKLWNHVGHYRMDIEAAYESR
jgi:hypothetical protein